MNYYTNKKTNATIKAADPWSAVKLLDAKADKCLNISAGLSQQIVVNYRTVEKDYRVMELSETIVGRPRSPGYCLAEDVRVPWEVHDALKNIAEKKNISISQVRLEAYKHFIKTEGV